MVWDLYKQSFGLKLFAVNGLKAPGLVMTGEIINMNECNPVLDITTWSVYPFNPLLNCHLKQACVNTCFKRESKPRLEQV